MKKNLKEFEHLTKDYNLQEMIKNDCKEIDRKQIRVRFYRTSIMYSVFDMLVDKDVYEDYNYPNNNTSKAVNELNAKIFDKHRKLDEEFSANSTSEIIK